MSTSPYRAIILRFSNDATHAAIDRVMQHASFSYAASIGAVPRVYANLAPDAQRWLNSSDVRGGLYPDVDPAKLLPLDEGLLERMRECEAIFMHMMARLEQTSIISYEERRCTYLWHLRYWNDFLEKQEINLLLAGILPHEIPDYIIYCLCKEKKIPTWIFHSTTICDVATLFSDIEDQAPDLRNRFTALLKEDNGAKDSVALSPMFEDYFRSQTQPAGKTAITFRRPTAIDRVIRGLRAHDLRSISGFLRWLPLLFSIAAWQGRVRKVLAWYRVRSLRTFYDQLAVPPDMGKSYIYVPLHFQPECSTCPMAGVFVDQLLTLQMLSTYAPAGVLLYVKEHPVQRKKGFACRSRKFYRDLHALPNVRLIEHSADTFALREHAQAVATATGTAGFEAIFRGKPVLMFGHRFYQDAPGVFPIHSNKDCHDAMHAIFVDHQKPDLRAVRLFLKAMEEACVLASLTDWHQAQASVLSKDQHTSAIADALQKRIDASSLMTS